MRMASLTLTVGSCIDSVLPMLLKQSPCCNTPHCYTPPRFTFDTSVQGPAGAAMGTAVYYISFRLTSGVYEQVRGRVE